MCATRGEHDFQPPRPVVVGSLSDQATRVSGSPEPGRSVSGGSWTLWNKCRGWGFSLVPVGWRKCGYLLWFPPVTFVIWSNPEGFCSTITVWWFGTCFFSHILGVIIPTDELIFFRGVGSTTNQDKDPYKWPCSPFLMGKLTISMAMFHSKLLAYSSALNALTEGKIYRKP